jgi:hypothetical protein
MILDVLALLIVSIAAAHTVTGLVWFLGERCLSWWRMQEFWARVLDERDEREGGQP